MNEKSKISTKLLVAMFVITLVVTLVARPINADAKDKTQNMLLVELFTSQGCSSCPPADKFFSELAEDEKLAVLAWHVPYWNYIGWKDPFSLELAEKRQRKYARRLRTDQIYTPQAVVAARKHYVGSDRRALGKSMRAAMKLSEEKQDAPQLTLLRKSESASERNFSLNIKPAQNKSERDSEFKLSVVIFQASADTDIKRGENRGKTLREANIVREVKEIGKWNGKADQKFSFQLPEQKNGFDVLRDGGVVVIAEPNDLSGVIAATRWDFKRGFKPGQSS